MFCPNCGQQLSDEAKFCPSCGNSVCQANPKTPIQDEEVIDLTNVSQKAPDEDYRVYKGTIISAVIMVFIQIVAAFIGYLICESLPLEPRQGFFAALLAVAFIGLPIGVIGIIVTSRKKKKAGELPAISKGVSFLLAAFPILSTALALTMGYLDGIVDHSVADFGLIILIPIFVLMSIFFIVTLALFTKGIGKEGMYKLWKWFFISFLLAPVLTYVLAKILEAMFIVIIIMIAGPILFLMCGGSVVFYRQQ